MNFWKIKRGNTSVQDIAVRDKDGALVQNLSEATAIKFQVSEHYESNGLIDKTKEEGIEVDTPEIGYLRITLLPAETNLPARKYFMGLQIKWSDEKIYETVMKVDGEITDRLEIIPELISC